MREEWAGRALRRRQRLAASTTVTIRLWPIATDFKNVSEGACGSYLTQGDRELTIFFQPFSEAAWNSPAKESSILARTSASLTRRTSNESRHNSLQAISDMLSSRLILSRLSAFHVSTCRRDASPYSVAVCSMNLATSPTPQKSLSVSSILRSGQYSGSDLAGGRFNTSP